MSEKCRNNNNSDNPLSSRRTDGGKNLNKHNNYSCDYPLPSHGTNGGKKDRIYS